MNNEKRQELEIKIEFEKLLIEEIHKRPFMYYKTDANHRNLSMRKEAWTEIGKALNKSDETCKKRWNNMRDTFKKFYSREIYESKRSLWTHYESLKFLLENGEIEHNDSDRLNNSSEPRDITLDLESTYQSDLIIKSNEPSEDVLTRKCGEIFITNLENFSYSCFICETTLNQIDKFTEHILTNHMGKDCNSSVSDRNDPINTTITKTEENSLDNIYDEEFLSDEIRIKPEDDENNIENESNYELENFFAVEIKKEETLNIEEKKEIEIKPRETNKIIIKMGRKLKTGVFPCDQCERIFDYQSKLQKHKRIHSDVRPYKCEICDKAFRHFGNLKDHIKISHNEERPFPCRHKDCDKKFKTNRIRKSHEILHTDDLPFQCQECGKRFPKSSYLIKHRKTWHDKNYRHQCPHCEKSFYAKQSLTFHIYTHTGERPYSCPICPTRFTKPGSAKEHMKIHSGERKYVCRTCGSAFNQIAGLIKHRKRHEEVVD